MDLLVTCVEAGLSLDAAMARVAQELELVAPMLAQELKQTLLEIQAGVRRSDAFHRLSTRTGVEDLRTLSAMIIQTEMFGTSVSRALRVHAEGMRTKRMQRAEEKAAMVSVKMTVPLIMCILPSLFAVVLGPAVAMIAKQMGPNDAGSARMRSAAASWSAPSPRLPWGGGLRRHQGRAAPVGGRFAARTSWRASWCPAATGRAPSRCSRSCTASDRTTPRC